MVFDSRDEAILFAHIVTTIMMIEGIEVSFNITSHERWMLDLPDVLSGDICPRTITKSVGCFCTKADIRYEI